MELDINLVVKLMKFKLKTKLSFTFVILVIICVSLISIFANRYFRTHFTEYIIQNQEQKYKDLVASVKRQYDIRKGQWNFEGINSIGVNALEHEIIITIKNSNGEVLWDAKANNSETYEAIFSNISERMSKHYPKSEVKYIEKQFVISFEGTMVGSVAIGQYGPVYFSEHDILFIKDLNNTLMRIGILAMLAALFFGIIMSYRLTTPISRVIETADLISKGYFGGRSNIKSTTTEINQLTVTVNHLAETLEKQENIRARITEDVAHELRTPLATVQSHLEAMIDGIWSLEVERLISCHEEIMRLNRLIGDLEKLAQFESESFKLNTVKFNINSLIERIILNFQNDFNLKGIIIKYSGETQFINGDKDKISQVIVNLLSNALKYSNGGGIVDFTLNGGKEEVEIRVRDSGMGISEEDINHIFERFYRVEKSRNRLTGGAGIGLTITKAIIEAHKGSIEVYSQLGQGTEFVIRIPKS